MYKLTLTKAEYRVLDWIVQEWDSEWNTQLEMSVEGPISFMPKIATLSSMGAKGILDPKASSFFVTPEGEDYFHCTFYPLVVLKYHCGVDFQLLQDPNGNPFLALVDHY